MINKSPARCITTSEAMPQQATKEAPVMNQHSVAHTAIAFEAMEIYPRHVQAAFTDIRREVAGDDPRHARAMIRAQHLMQDGKCWRDRPGVFHVESATTRNTVYHVDITGACSCPANGVCKHQYMERADRLARQYAHSEAWAHVRLQDGCHIWRTTTGYLACFDGAVIAHTTQPHEARAALQDYQQGLVEHDVLAVAQPVANLRIELVNGMHGAYLAALIDAGYSAEAPDRVAAQRAQRAAEVRAAIVVERAA
jgi:hypothetical protein